MEIWIKTKSIPVSHSLEDCGFKPTTEKWSIIFLSIIKTKFAAVLLASKSERAYSSDKKVANVRASPNSDIPHPTYVITVKAL